MSRFGTYPGFETIANIHINVNFQAFTHLRNKTRCFDKVKSKRIEYILEWNSLEKSVKRPFCCTVSILQVYFTYLRYKIFWALEHHFIENLELILK